ncbi:hypothetical protein C7S14_7794 [Burkholderia cepacia]|nr:hypothetical protein [Burkholderia cepacia]QOH36294.1 hypothetical protein C7S14_7794 [Burkholderia cepacia]
MATWRTAIAGRFGRGRIPAGGMPAPGFPSPDADPRSPA